VLSQDQIALIHGEIDGANTPEEQAAVQALLAREAEARALDAELRHLARLFDRVGTAEPPARLRGAILAALPPLVPAASGWRGLRDVARSVGDGFHKRPRFALISALCVGLVAGFGLFAALAGTGSLVRATAGGVTGTLVEPYADRLETVQDLPIDAGGVRGRVRVEAGEHVVVVTLETDAAHPVEVRLSFRPGAYGLREFSQRQHDAEPFFSAEPGRIRSTTSGANTQSVVLDQAGTRSPLELSLIENGEKVFTTTLH
jgi:anti-sigma factor RsiW